VAWITRCRSSRGVPAVRCADVPVLAGLGRRRGFKQRHGGQRGEGRKSQPWLLGNEERDALSFLHRGGNERTRGEEAEVVMGRRTRAIQSADTIFGRCTVGARGDTLLSCRKPILRPRIITPRA
jgi:hypothetical protein